MSTITRNIRATEEPQALFALTVISPLVEPAVVTIEVVVEVPFHPEGNVHV
ncbi:MAG: hypothetical protein V1781_07935 [Bacteroidota bacterium]